MAGNRPVHTAIRAGWTQSPALALVFAAVLAGAPVARADWGFTHWGMTPEQVLGASGDTAHLIAPAAHTRDVADNWEVAVEGVVCDGGLTLDGGYMFDMRGGGLRCVVYNAAGDDVGKLRDSLLSRYGRPGKDSAFGPLWNEECGESDLCGREEDGRFRHKPATQGRWRHTRERTVAVLWPGSSAPMPVTQPGWPASRKRTSEQGARSAVFGGKPT